MADIGIANQVKMEKVLDMGGGYVLDFSNDSFQRFVDNSVGVDIYDEKYDLSSGSKANRLRSFWDQEPNHRVAKLLADLLEYAKARGLVEERQLLFEECQAIVVDLSTSSAVGDLPQLPDDAGDQCFEMLADAVGTAIAKGQPEAGLDRLHTYAVKYARRLCQSHGITTERQKPLHSLFGEYIKFLRGNGFIESPITERILKSSISIMDAYNQVRNEKSLAHDNVVLNREESMLVLDYVIRTLRFVQTLEDHVGS